MRLEVQSVTRLNEFKSSIKNIPEENELIQMKSQADYCQIDAVVIQNISALVDESFKMTNHSDNFSIIWIIFQWSG